MEAEQLLAGAFSAAHPIDAARLLEALPAAEAAVVFERTEPRVAAGVLERMAPGSAAECLTDLAPERAGMLLAALRLDLGAALLRRLEAEARERILAGTPGEVARSLRRLLGYPPHTAGALMDPRVLVLPDEVTAGDALARVRRAPRHLLSYLYVVDGTQVLVGVVGLGELMLAPRAQPLAALMRPRVPRLGARADRTAILAHPGWRELHALPVVEDGGMLVGAIRYEMLRRLEDEMAGSPAARGALEAALVLGEACVAGFSGLLADVARAMAGPAERGHAG
jgi:magnesium transporter